MFILEQKFGNDGYSFWFKLLEILGSSDGHVFDCKNESSWEFLQAKTRLDSQTCINILDLLSKLEAIDSELWKNKIVWSDNFLKGIADVYKNRKVDKPEKPIYTQKPFQEIVSTSRNTSDSTVSTQINPQSKLKETKLNEIKVDESIPNEIIQNPKTQTEDEEFVEIINKIKKGEPHQIEIDKDYPLIDGKTGKYTLESRNNKNLHTGLKLWQIYYGGMFKTDAFNITYYQIDPDDLEEVMEKINYLYENHRPIMKDSFSNYFEEQKQIKGKPDLLEFMNRVIENPEIYLEYKEPEEVF